MAFLCRSRLFGLLLILASLPLDPGTALAISAAATSAPAATAAEAMEARLQRIATALRERQAAGEPAGAIPDNAVAWVGWANGGGRAGWANGGGFRNGGWGNGGFRNGGWGNGGFRNGGGWGNGGGGFRNFRNW
ncbi:MAG: GrrA/OscA1 family cyclophane-containing rSAM-modified RiPP [Cyanobium sp.]